MAGESLVCRVLSNKTKIPADKTEEANKVLLSEHSLPSVIYQCINDKQLFHMVSLHIRSEGTEKSTHRLQSGELVDF